MEKTVRVCDECGAEFGEPCDAKALAYVCSVCGRELCHQCTRGYLGDYHGELECELCPTHYEQVKEFIEGLKEPPTIHAYDNLCGQVVGTKWVDGKITELKVDGVKFVPEEPKESEWIVFKAGGEYRVNHSGTDCAGWASDRGSCRFIQLVPGAANALYEHIRRERGHS